MDPLTHTLTGLAMSRAGFKRWCPQATWILLLAANAPDVDAATALGGAAAYLRYHRHLTHAFLLAPALAALPVLLLRLKYGRALNWKRGYGIAFAGVVSHMLLDWTNVYGVRLLLPFSAEWLRLDITSVIDLWIWAILIVAAVGPVLSGLVSTEIGARPGSGRGIALFALALLLLYEAGRFVLHERAVAVLEARLYNGRPPAQVAAMPGPGNPFRWRGLIGTSSFYAVQEVNLLEEFDPSEARILYKPEPNPAQAAAAEAARRTGAFRAFLEFSQSPLWRFTPTDDPEGGIKVEAMDLRFGAPPNSRFVATAIVAPDGRVVRSWFAF